MINPSSKNITLFAGSGFSRAVSEKVNYFGSQKLIMPLGGEMFTSSRDYLSDEQAFPKYYRLGTYLKKEHGSPTPNQYYETVYGKLIKYEENDLAETLEDLVFENLGVNYPPIRVAGEVEQTIGIIREFLARENISRVITTNPDILLDVAIAGATEFDDGFLRLFGEPCRDIIKLITRETEPWQPVVGLSRGRGRCAAIEYFVKLHGSITMALAPDAEDCVYLHDKYKWQRGISTAMYRHDGKFKLCVIPPSPEKRYDKFPWENFLESALAVLLATEKLIFYGFGFSDTDTKLGEALKKRIPFDKFDIHVIDAQFDSCLFREKAANFLGVDRNRVSFRKPC